MNCKEAVIAFDRSPRRDDRTRVNERIRVREIRVIDDTGAQLGIMPPPQALAIAKQKGLDLVEISPTAVPPVCRIMDFGKYQYQEQKRAREARKHQKVIEVKEIKFRPKVDEHDYQFKKKHIERFLEDGDKVKATIFFRGREMAHPEIGRRILERLVEELSDVALAETMPRMEGNQMHTILTPAAAERRRQGEGGGDERRDGKTQPQSAQSRRSTFSASSASSAVNVRDRCRKLKTHRGAAKRFKRTKNGKFLRGQGVQAAHPEQQDEEAEARAAGHDDGRRRRRAEAGADASV